MPIEFKCGNCQTVLRTPDGSAGKSARCPGCGNVQPIPQTNSAQQYENVPDAIPVGAPTRHNPYSQPTTSDFGSAGQAMTAAIAKTRVQPAAITWLVVSILLSLAWAMGIIGGIVEMATEGVLPEDIGAMIGMMFLLFLALMGVLGAICMLQMRNRKLAIAGAICSMFPGFLCCFLPIGVPIWALIVLLDGSTKPYFS